MNKYKTMRRHVRQGLRFKPKIELERKTKNYASKVERCMQEIEMFEKKLSLSSKLIKFFFWISSMSR